MTVTIRYLIRVRDVRDLSRPVQYAGKSTLGVSSPQSSPVGLTPWKFWGDARKDLNFYLSFTASIIRELNHYNYEIVRLEKKTSPATNGPKVVL